MKAKIIVSILSLVFVLSACGADIESSAGQSWPVGYFDHDVSISQQTYDEWFSVLGSDESVQHYIDQVHSCILACHVDGSSEAIVFDPGSTTGQVCECIYEGDK